MNEAALAFARELLKKNILLDDIVASDIAGDTGCEWLDEANERLMAIARDPGISHDTNDFDTLIVLAVDGLRQPASPVPWPLAIFAADVLEGKRKRPIRRGPDKDASWIENYSLFRAVEAVAAKFGMPAYSHNELSTKETAADVVAKALNCSLPKVINVYKTFKRKSGRKRG